MVEIMVNRYFRIKAGGDTDEEISKEVFDWSIVARDYAMAKHEGAVPDPTAPPAPRGSALSGMQRSTQDPVAVPSPTTRPAEQVSDVSDMQRSTQFPTGFGASH